MDKDKIAQEYANNSFEKDENIIKVSRQDIEHVAFEVLTLAESHYKAIIEEKNKEIENINELYEQIGKISDKRFHIINNLEKELSQAKELLQDCLNRGAKPINLQAIKEFLNQNK